MTQYRVTEYGLSTCAFRSEADDHCCEAVRSQLGEAPYSLCLQRRENCTLSPRDISLSARGASSQMLLRGHQK